MPSFFIACLAGVSALPVMAGLSAASADSLFSMPQLPSFSSFLPEAPFIGHNDASLEDSFQGFFVSAKAGAIDQMDKGKSAQGVVAYSGVGATPASAGALTSGTGVGDQIGARFAGSVGYDARIGNLVFGPELVIGSRTGSSYASSRGSFVSNGAYAPNVFGSVRPYLDATARMKLGYVVMPQLMLYGFGGMGFDVARANIGDVGSDRVFGALSAGVGMEYALSKSWGLMLEYEYRYDFTQSASGSMSGFNGSYGPYYGVASTSFNPSSHALTAGVLYHF